MHPIPGVSLITQVLYILVFCTRYLNIFWSPPFKTWIHAWNFILKLFYISSSLYIVFLMMRVYARTREREKGWRLGIYSLAGSLLLMMPVTGIFDRKNFRVVEVRHSRPTNPPAPPKPPRNQSLTNRACKQNLWNFSLILESVCVLPQLLLLRQTTVPTVLDSFYLVTLGSYRFFYILNWIVRWASRGQPNPDPVSVIFGVVQTALYADFAWVYWTRQRVKLRGGGIVDSEDLRRGWLVNKVIGGRSGNDDAEEEEDEESRPVLDAQDDGGGRHKPSLGPRGWGKRGISVSADEGVLEEGRAGQEQAQPLTDPAAFEDEESENEREVDTTRADPDGNLDGVSNGAEWRDERGKQLDV